MIGWSLFPVSWGYRDAKEVLASETSVTQRRSCGRCPGSPTQSEGRRCLQRMPASGFGLGKVPSEDLRHAERPRALVQDGLELGAPRVIGLNGREQDARPREAFLVALQPESARLVVLRVLTDVERGEKQGEARSPYQPVHLLGPGRREPVGDPLGPEPDEGEVRDVVDGESTGIVCVLALTHREPRRWRPSASRRGLRGRQVVTEEHRDGLLDHGPAVFDRGFLGSADDADPEQGLVDEPEELTRRELGIADAQDAAAGELL